MVDCLHTGVLGFLVGPSPPIKKWSGGGSHRVPKAQEGESMRGGIIPPLVRGVWGPPPRKFLNLSASMCVFNGGLCV